MDLLVLDRVLAALDGTLRGAVLLEISEEDEGRYRLLAGSPGGKPVPVVVGLHAERPWIGRPVPRRGRREKAPKRPPTPFAALCARALQGTAVVGVERMGDDRIAVVRVSSGDRLVAELGRGPTLVLVRADGVVAGAARRPRAAQERLAAGAIYQPPRLPEGRLPALRAEPAEVDRRVRELTATGLALEGALRRVVFGIGPETAERIAAEAIAAGVSPGAVLAARRARLATGEDAPCIEGALDPIAEAERGSLDLRAFRLLPWASASRHLAGHDAADTAGLFHEASALAAGLSARAAGLATILRREAARLWEAEAKAASDAAGFEAPERHGRWGEALLAGLARARREGDVAWVPDPYDAEARPLAVPAPAGRSLAEAAHTHFARQRRARRGLDGARRRQAELRERRERIEQLAARAPQPPSVEAVAALETAMRQEGIAVGLTRPAGRRAPPVPRVEGVRLYSSSEGWSVLVGRTGKDNARVTFKIAAPEDFWLHALGVPGAHVVVRNPERRKSLPPATLREAAALAAWYSDAKTEAQADVQVARRKDVRAAKGAPPGTVTLKRATTVRVRPELPKGVSEGAG